MPESEAIAATRYCYAFYAMHYLMIDLEMGQKDWEFLISMDILTPEEVAFLLAQPSPNLVRPIPSSCFHYVSFTRAVCRL
jgi:hypothetical protein